MIGCVRLNNIYYTNIVIALRSAGLMISTECPPRGIAKLLYKQELMVYDTVLTTSGI